MATAAVQNTREGHELTIATPRQLKNFLETEGAQRMIKPFLPEGLDAERVAAQMWVLAKREPKILKCTPESIVTAIARALESNLEIGTTVHLVPFGDKLETIIDYKGKIELIVRTGAARSIDAKVVYKNDDFSYEYGIDQQLVHRPTARGAVRGEITNAYAIARLAFNTVKFVVMTAEEIDAIRLKYSKQWKEGPLQPWYAKKTCVHQISKEIPRNVRLAKVLALFAREEEEEFGAPLGEVPVSPLVASFRDEDDFPHGQGVASDGEVGDDFADEGE